MHDNQVARRSREFQIMSKNSCFMEEFSVTMRLWLLNTQEVLSTCSSDFVAGQLPASSLARAAPFCSRGVSYLPNLAVGPEHALGAVCWWSMENPGQERNTSSFLSHRRCPPNAKETACPPLVPADVPSVLGSPQTQCSLPKVNAATPHNIRTGLSPGSGTGSSSPWDRTLRFLFPVLYRTGRVLVSQNWHWVPLPWPSWLGALPVRRGLQRGLSLLPGEDFVSSLTTSLKNDALCLLEGHRVRPRLGSFECLIFISAGLMCWTGPADPVGCWLPQYLLTHSPLPLP